MAIFRLLHAAQLTQRKARGSSTNHDRLEIKGSGTLNSSSKHPLRPNPNPVPHWPLVSWKMSVLHDWAGERMGVIMPAKPGGKASRVRPRPPSHRRTPFVRRHR